jgi:RNA polymerase sigma factor (sigma-70 family)
MSPEELFNKYEHYAKTTLHKVFHNPNAVAKNKHLSYDDLLQYARLGLWQACNSYTSDKQHLKFTSFAIRNIRWVLYRQLSKEGLKNLYYKSKDSTDDNIVSLVSMSDSPTFNDSKDAKTYYETVSYDNINQFEDNFVESEIIANCGANEMLECLTESEKEMVLMKANEYLSYKEIGERLGVTKQAIGVKFKKIQNKILMYLGRNGSSKLILQ